MHYAALTLEGRLNLGLLSSGFLVASGDTVFVFIMKIVILEGQQHDLN